MSRTPDFGRGWSSIFNKMCFGLQVNVWREPAGGAPFRQVRGELSCSFVCERRETFNSRFEGCVCFGAYFASLFGSCVEVLIKEAFDKKSGADGHKSGGKKEQLFLLWDPKSETKSKIAFCEEFSQSIPNEATLCRSQQQDLEAKGARAKSLTNSVHSLNYHLTSCIFGCVNNFTKNGNYECSSCARFRYKEHE